MDPMKGAFIGVFGTPVLILLIAYGWRHPWEALAVIGIIIALLAAAVYDVHQRERAPAVELDNADTAKAQQEALRYALLDAWKPRGNAPEIEGKWPKTKPVAKHVRHPSGVGLKLNRD